MGRNPAEEIHGLLAQQEAEINFYIWAGVATAFSWLILYVWLRSLGLREVKHAYLYVLFAVPLSAIVNLFVKRPIGLSLLSLFKLKTQPTSWPLWFLFLALLLAPLTEEVIKISPLILGRIRRKLQDEKVAYIVGALFGFGFGVGEAWYLAFTLTREMPEVASGPLLQLAGFFGERFEVMMIHAWLTIIVTCGFSRGRLLKYYMIAVFFHYLVNTAAGFYQKGLIPVEAAVILVTIPFFILFRYVFTIERRLRKEDVERPTGEVLYSRDGKA